MKEELQKLLGKKVTLVIDSNRKNASNTFLTCIIKKVNDDSIRVKIVGKDQKQIVNLEKITRVEVNDNDIR